MAKKTTILCQNNFKSTDPAATRDAFNKQLAILISRTADKSAKMDSSERSESEAQPLTD